MFFPSDAFGTVGMTITVEIHNHERPRVFECPIIRFHGVFIVFDGLSVGIFAVVRMTFFANAAAGTSAMVDAPEGVVRG